MHIIILVAFIIALVVVVMMMRAAGRTGGGEVPAPGNALSGKYGLAFVSDGKLFYQMPGQELRELQSPHVRTMMERLDRHQQLHGWKEGTSFNRSLTGRDRTVASHVASFDIAADGAILFSNGYGVFDLREGDPPQLLLRDKLVADVVAVPEPDPEANQLGPW